MRYVYLVVHNPVTEDRTIYTYAPHGHPVPAGASPDFQLFKYAPVLQKVVRAPEGADHAQIIEKTIKDMQPDVVEIPMTLEFMKARPGVVSVWC